MRLILFLCLILSCLTAYATDIEQGIEAVNQGNYPEAFNIFDELAQKQDAQAQRNLAHLYINGWGVNQDISKARYWYQMAANNGDPAALHNLAVLYQQGQFVDKDLTTAITLYEQAAKQGLAQSQYNLALLYYAGEGVEQNTEKALTLFKQAAEQGMREAENNIQAIKQGVVAD